MKTVKYKILVLLIAALPVFTNIGKSHQLESAATLSYIEDPTRTIRIGIVGLQDSRLELARKTILAVPGVSTVDFDVSKKQAKIDLDVERTDIRTLQKALRNAGLTPWFR